MRFAGKRTLLILLLGVLGVLDVRVAHAQGELDSNILPDGGELSSQFDVRANLGKNHPGSLAGANDCPPGTPPERCISPSGQNLDNQSQDTVHYFNPVTGVKGEMEAEKPRQMALGAIASPYVLAAATVKMVEPALGDAWMDSIAHAIANWHTTVASEAAFVQSTKGASLQQSLLYRAHQFCVLDAMASGPPSPDALASCAKNYDFSYLPEHPSRAVEGVAARSGIRSPNCPTADDVTEICLSDLIFNQTIEQYQNDSADPGAAQSLGNLKAIDTFMAEHGGDIKFIMTPGSGTGSGGSSTPDGADIENTRVVKAQYLPPIRDGKELTPNQDITFDAKKRYIELVRVMKKYCDYVVSGRGQYGTGAPNNVDEYGVPQFAGAILDFNPFEHIDFWSDTKAASNAFNADDMRALSLPDFRFTPALGDALFNYFIIGGGLIPGHGAGDAYGVEYKCNLLSPEKAQQESDLFSAPPPTDEAGRKTLIETLDKRRQRYWAFAMALSEGRYLAQTIIIKRGIERLAQNDELVREAAMHLATFQLALPTMYSNALDNLRSLAEIMFKERAQTSGQRANFLGKGGRSNNDPSGMSMIGGGQ